MLVRDLMRAKVLTVTEDQPVQEVIEMLVREHIHGIPVVDDTGELVGVVTQQDIFFSASTLGAAGIDGPGRLKVREVMTSPAVTVDDDADLQTLCSTMHRLRIHRLPVVREGRMVGIVSSLDICGLVSRGELP
jgi:CBS domain-containing protein